MHLTGLMANKICYIAAAGSGKTTFLIRNIYEHHYDGHAIIVTFTTVNQINIVGKIRGQFGHLPNSIKVLGWYEFVFKYFILPYKSDVIPQLNTIPISLLFDPMYTRTFQTKDGRRFAKYRKDDKVGKYFSRGWKLHKDLVSEFACECIKGNENSIAIRLTRAADIICFDESQDLGGYDLEIIKFIAKRYTGKVLLATDPRQHIYSTTKYGGNFNGRIDEYIRTKINTKNKEYITIDDVSLSHSHRCVEPICKLATSLFSTMPPTLTCSCEGCVKRREQYEGSKGVVAVSEHDIELFSKNHNPVNLVYNKIEQLQIFGKVMTMGDSKGTESNVILLFLTEDMARFIFNDRTVVLKDQTRNKLYVSITRARYLLGIVYRDKYKFENKLIPKWENIRN